MKLCTFVALDLGQSQDPTATIVMDRHVYVPAQTDLNLALRVSGWTAPELLNTHQLAALDQARPPEAAPLWVRGIKRYSLGTRYQSVVEDTRRLLATIRHPERTALLIDQTGVGAGVIELFHAAGLNPIGISITAGDRTNAGPGGWRVPKRDLVSAVQVALQNRRLRFAQGLPELPALLGELKSFRVKIDPKTAHDSYSAWRENQHDDLVLALALACWYERWHGETWSARDAAALSTGQVL